MKSNFEKLLKLCLQIRTSQDKQPGFTLTELLVVILVGGIVVSALLAQVVDFLSIDLKESALAETQREMTIALDYIAQDVREAVYVYDGAELTEIEPYLPDFGTNRKPILAFWKVERLPYIQDSDPKYNFPDNCDSPSPLLTDNNGDGDRDEETAECKTITIERSTYTLVTYLQNTSGADGTWQGESRIERYELRKYLPDELNKLTHTTGYVDPRQQSTFKSWPDDPISLSSLQGTRPTDTANTLVDFVAAYNSSSVSAQSCSAGYTRTPTDTNYKSFYGCVRSADTDNAFNQDAIIYLTGNAYGKSGISNNSAYLSQLEVQVINRGVIDRNPTE
jgi:prepilin-type N-terminal cleavage/methylation domain-containing protein